MSSPPSAPDHFPTLLSQVLSSRVSEPSPTRVHTHAHTRTRMYTLTRVDACTHVFSSDPFLTHIPLVNNLVFLRQLKSLSDPQSGLLKC